MAEARDLQESISLTSDLPLPTKSPNGSDGTETEDDVSYETIHQVPYTLILTICYVMLALVTYDIDFLDDSVLRDKGLYHEIETGFCTTKAYLRAIKVLEAITSVVTIPMTSAVCSSVAVVLLQRPPVRGRRGYTLRQMMTLSDKLWSDPLLISKLVTGGWRRYGSIFLVCAILLNLLGASISPVQNLVQSYKSHKVLAKYDVAEGQLQPEMINAKDFQSLISDDQFNFDLEDGDENHDSRLGDIILQLQKRLSATSLDTPQFRLWSRNQTANYKSSVYNLRNELESLYEISNQSSFRSLPWLNDPFCAYPPSRLNTGLFQQFASRVDFKVNFTMISQTEFPETCNEPNNLAIHQDDLDKRSNTAYALDLCLSVPDQTWKKQLTKQDFVEELFMRINITSDRDILAKIPEPGVYYTKTAVRTTTGYFELPNYENKQFPGPLLSDGPNSHCSHQCNPQDWGRAGGSGRDFNSSSLWFRHRAPLYATTMAVFGNGSVFEKDDTKFWNQHSAAPMCALLLKDGAEGWECYPFGFGHGFRDNKTAAAFAQLNRVEAAQNFLSLFTTTQDSSANVTSIERAFEAAAILFIDQWHEQGEHQLSFYITRSLGMELQIPHMAKSGIILVSTLLGVFLSCLLGLAIYSAVTPRWTAQLDSFAMMRIGASIAPELPFRFCRDTSDVRVLDTLPGWVGEAPTSSSPKTGEISLGGTTGISSKRRYAYYRRKHTAKKKGPQTNHTSRGR